MEDKDKEPSTEVSISIELFFSCLTSINRRKLFGYSDVSDSEINCNIKSSVFTLANGVMFRLKGVFLHGGKEN